MGERIKLKVLGLSYSQTQSGAYALVLSEENGDRRIPIIIGAFEAQAIAIELESLKPPRPLTHDLFVNFAQAFSIELVEVNIHRLEEGIFYSELVCESAGTRIKIDARTSDAVALAIRFGNPIYTTEQIMEKAGIILPVEDKLTADKSDDDSDDFLEEESFESNDVEELESLLQQAIENENYEEASRLRDEINRLKG